MLWRGWLLSGGLSRREGHLSINPWCSSERRGAWTPCPWQFAAIKHPVIFEWYPNPFRSSLEDPCHFLSPTKCPGSGFFSQQIICHSPDVLVRPKQLIPPCGISDVPRIYRNKQWYQGCNFSYLFIVKFKNLCHWFSGESSICKTFVDWLFFIRLWGKRQLSWKLFHIHFVLSSICVEFWGFGPEASICFLQDHE